MTPRRFKRRWLFGRAVYTFPPVPPCLAGIIAETQARWRVTLAKDFAK